MALQITEKDKILVVAPHPDDETIGCGGLLIKYGKQCDVLLVTDGRFGIGKNSSVKEPDMVAKRRKKEFISVMEQLNVNKYICLDLPNEGLNKENLKKLKEINIENYTKVFIPGKYEQHHEHIAISSLFRKQFIFHRRETQLYEYEVWTPLHKSGHLLDISDVMDKKLEIMEMYESQLECYDYISIFKGLNTYRGKINGVDYAELFRPVTPASILIRKYIRKSLQRINIKK